MSGLKANPKTGPNIRLSDIKHIRALADKSMSELREINRRDDRAYNGPNMTKDQLIYQIVFKADAPDPGPNYKDKIEY